jgi:hypothetical protein
MYHRLLVHFLPKFSIICALNIGVSGRGQGYEVSVNLGPVLFISKLAEIEVPGVNKLKLNFANYFGVH